MTPTPPFVPHPLVRGGHMQTIVGRFWPGPNLPLPSEHHLVDAGDGDRLSVLVSDPEGGLPPGGPVAVLVHGLAGSAEAPYLTRLAARLRSYGVRTVRMNLRNAGAGFGLARGVYHAGRTDDLRAVVEWAGVRASGSPVAMVGFSLGGNLVLKLAAELNHDPSPCVDAVIAANPPVDLERCCLELARPSNRAYDRNFTRFLIAEMTRLHAAVPELGPLDLKGVKTLYEFDEAYTAPRNDFRDVQDYYGRSSSARFIPKIRVDGLVVHAADDPFIPAECFTAVSFPERLALEMKPSGGHLGYVGRSARGGVVRWLDGRVADWLTARWGLANLRRG